MSIRAHWLTAIIMVAGSVAACGDDNDGSNNASSTSNSGGGGVTPSPTPDGWASYHASNAAVVTRGGDGADAAHTYTVTTRSELIKALYPDAVITADGTFTTSAGADATPKIIYVKGTINLSVDGSLNELGFDDYKDPAFDFAQYVETYKPSVWNANPANWDAATNRPMALSGPLKEARERSAEKQGAIVRIRLGSNTSLIGLNDDAKIVKGNIVIGAGVSSVIIRNITFEDAFDYFPEWDPTENFVVDTTQAGCQAAYVDAGTGPQKCPGGRWNASFSDYDNISINGGTHIWIDHNSFNDGERENYMFPSVFEAPHVGDDYMVQHHDGAVDAIGPSDFVTISYNHIKNHDKTHLLGNRDNPTEESGWGRLSFTVHHNYYENAGQRLPRVRVGKVHVYNNYMTGQIGYLGKLAPTDGTVVPNNRYLYGIGIGNLAKIYSEANVMEVQDAPSGTQVNDSVMCFVWHTENITINNVLEKTYFYDSGSTLNGSLRDLMAVAQATSAAAGKPVLESTADVWKPSTNYSYTALPAAEVKAHVLDNAGAGKL